MKVADPRSARARSPSLIKNDTRQAIADPTGKLPVVQSQIRGQLVQSSAKRRLPASICGSRASTVIANSPRATRLPILAVDEPIYRRLPCFMIATVDKFAAMPWTGEVGGFFGRGSEI